MGFPYRCDIAAISDLAEPSLCSKIPENAPFNVHWWSYHLKRVYPSFECRGFEQQWLWPLTTIFFRLFPPGNSRAFFGHQSSFISLWTWDLALLTFLPSQFMSFCKTQEALHFWRYVCCSSVILQSVLMFPGLMPKGGFAWMLKLKRSEISFQMYQDILTEAILWESPEVAAGWWFHSSCKGSVFTWSAFSKSSSIKLNELCGPHEAVVCPVVRSYHGPCDGFELF